MNTLVSIYGVFSFHLDRYEFFTNDKYNMLQSGKLMMQYLRLIHYDILRFICNNVDNKHIAGAVQPLCTNKHLSLICYSLFIKGLSEDLKKKRLGCTY